MFRYRPRPLRRSALALLVFLVVLVSTASILAANSQPPPDPPLNPPLNPLRSLDRQLERWAWQLATPDAVKPDAADLEAARDRLRRLAAAEDESARKADVLLRRAEELHRSATSRRARAEQALEPASAPRSLVPTHKAAGCSAAMALPVGEWVVDPASTAEGLWLAFTAPEAGTWLVHTAGSRADTKLERWSECAASAPVEVNDDGIGLRSRLVFEAAAGETIRLRLTSTADDRVLVAAARASTGSISGRVTEAASGEPISGVEVIVFGWTTTPSVSTFSEEDGTWNAEGLSQGYYDARALPAPGSSFLSQYYLGKDCFSQCSPVLGDDIYVARAASVTGIDFSLNPGTGLIGTVREADTGLTISGAQVEAHTSQGVALVMTDESGRYRFLDLPAGEVRLVAESPSYRGRIWPDVSCSPSGCDPQAGSPIEILEGEPLRGIDLELERLGVIEGRIVDSSTQLPWPGITVSARRPESGYVVESVETDAEGRYSLGGLEPGCYHVEAQAYEVVPMFWPDVACPGFCEIAGEPIEVALQEKVTGIDLEVTAYGVVRGMVTDERTGEVVESGEILYYDASGNLIDSDDPWSGRFELRVASQARLAFEGWGSSKHRDELWNDVPCPFSQPCDPLEGDLLEVPPGATLEGVDFALEPLGQIRGTVRFESGEPVAGADLRVYPANGDGQSEYGWRTDENGEYTVSGLVPDTYFLLVRSDIAVDEAYDGIACDDWSCDPRTGTPIVVSEGEIVSGIDLDLVRAPTIRGLVEDSTTREPIAGADVYLEWLEGYDFWHTVTGADGRYELTGMNAGAYRMSVYGPGDYLDRIVGGDLCDRHSGTCDVATADPIEIDLGEIVVRDTTLRVGGALEGSVADRSGWSVPYGKIYLFDSGRVLASSTFGGDWRLSGLLPGEYFVLYDSDAYQSQWYGGIAESDTDCPGPSCSPRGQPVSVSFETTTSAVDFVVDRLGSLRGSVVDAETGKTVENGDVSIRSQDGSFAASTRIHRGEFSFESLPKDSYRVAAIGMDQHLSRVYGGDLCTPECDFSVGTLVSVDFESAIFVSIPVTPGPGIGGRVLDGATQIPLPGVALDLWSGLGHHLDTAASGADGSFRFFLEPQATYYLSTDTGSEYGDIVWEGVDCPDGSAFEGACDPTAGTPIVLEEYQPLVPIEIRLEGGTPPTLFRDGFESGTMGAWSLSP